MPTMIRIDAVDAAGEHRVIVKRLDTTLAGHVLATFGLMADGTWRRIGDEQPYPDECVLPVQKAAGDPA